MGYLSRNRAVFGLPVAVSSLPVSGNKPEIPLNLRTCPGRTSVGSEMEEWLKEPIEAYLG